MEIFQQGIFLEIHTKSMLPECDALFLTSSYLLLSKYANLKSQWTFLWILAAFFPVQFIELMN
jgi:hypothetical protein